jgi:hypothetical protein
MLDLGHGRYACRGIDPSKTLSHGLTLAARKPMAATFNQAVLSRHV